MDMGTVKGTEIGAVRGTGHVEKLAADDSVVVQYVVDSKPVGFIYLTPSHPINIGWSRV